MGVYGQYETVSELSRNGATTVSRARPADGGWDLGFDALGSDANYVLKAYHAGSTESDAGEAEFFLQRARAQQGMAERGGRHWAPVLQVGTANGDAFYVTHYYPSSADRIARSAQAVDAPTLHALVTGTLRGLLELRRAQHRPHGNIKATNVLLRTTRDVTPDDVLLTDPALEEDATIAGEVEDLFNLGELIYEVVLGRRFTGQHTWPVPMSHEWKHLGRKGEAWLALCNHLLSPRAAENWLRLDEVVDEVNSLRPRKNRLRSRKLWVSLATLAIVAGVGAGGYLHYVGQWRALCAEYGEWVGPMNERLSRDIPPAIAQDPYLQEHLVRALNDARAHDVELDPHRIAGSSDALPALAEHPPLSFNAAWKTDRAARVVHQIDKSLSPGVWQALGELARRRSDYDHRAWPNLVAYADSLNAAAQSKRADRVDSIAHVVDGVSRLARLDAARAAARAELDRLVARAAGASAIRDRIAEFESPLRSAGDADVTAASAAGVDALTGHLEKSTRTVATFDQAVPLLADAAKRQRAYEVRGWNGAAKALGTLLDRARPDGKLADLATDLSAAKAQWDAVEVSWGQIESRRRLLETSGDPLVATYRQYVAKSGLADASSLPALAKALDTINRDPTWTEVARRVSAPEWSNLDVVEFARKSAAHKAFAGKTVATDADLRQWISDVDGYGSQLASAQLKGNGEHGKIETVAPPATMATKPAWTPTPTTLAATAPTTPPSTVASIGTKPGPTTVASASTRPSPTTVASDVARPAPATTDSGKPRPGPTTIASAIPRPWPTTLESHKPEPTRIGTTGPTPTTSVAVTPKVDPEALRRQREKEQRDKEIASFVAEAREVAIKANNREIKDAWRARNDELADRVAADHALYTPQLKSAREILRGRLLQLDSAYQSTRAPLAIKPPAEPWGGPLVNALQSAAPRRDDDLKGLIALATSSDSKFESALGELDDLDTQWRASAAHLVADSTRVAQLLEQGYVPGKSADGAPLASALTSVRTSELYKYDGVQQALEPLLRPVSVVEAEGNAPSAMRLLAESTDQPLGIRLAAWGKEGKEVTTQTLQADLKVAGTLLDEAQRKAADKARVEAIKARLEADVRTRWGTLLETARRDQDVEAAIELHDRIPGIVADALPPRARFNFALHDLRSALGAGKGEGVSEEVARKAQEVKRVSGSLLPDEGSRPAVLALVAEIDRLGKGAPADLAHLGPASEAARGAAGKINWSTMVDPGGDKVTYRALITTELVKEEVALVFRRVRTSEGAPASWVATNEASLGLFCDLLGAAGKWPEIRSGKMLAEYDPQRVDPRPGPRVWEWPRYARSADVTWARTWLSADFVPPRVDHYPDGIGSEFNRSQIGNAQGERSEELNPSRRQPMQYVSPRAAALAASVAGCRLPTVAEWQAANKSVEKHIGINLRDQTWRLELEHMRKRAFGGKCRPDAGMFVPEGEKPSDDVWPRAGGGELNDGVLWFHEVPPAAPVFVDLVGNVAEMVTDEAGRVCVIGGSALTPPSRPNEKPFAIGADQGAGGFSDVGFRLAFSEPAAGVEKLKGALAGNWYLTAR